MKETLKTEFLRPINIERSEYLLFYKNYFQPSFELSDDDPALLADLHWMIDRMNLGLFGYCISLSTATDALWLYSIRNRVLEEITLDFAYMIITESLEVLIFSRTDRLLNTNHKYRGHRFRPTSVGWVHKWDGITCDWKRSEYYAKNYKILTS